jgi:hypothetical protein
MQRINSAFQWAFFLGSCFAAGARGIAGPRGDLIGMLWACALIIGFLAWAFIAYCFAWALAIRDIRARMRCARAVTVSAQAGGAGGIAPKPMLRLPSPPRSRLLGADN